MTPEVKAALEADYGLPLLVMLVGLPRAGKTTLALSTGYPIVCADAIRLALTGERFLPRAEPMVWTVAKLMVASLFEAGHRVVVLDATNISRARRAEWDDPRWARGYLVLRTPYWLCQQRAAASPDRPGLAAVITRMADNSEWPTEDGDEGQVFWLWVDGVGNAAKGGASGG